MDNETHEKLKNVLSDVPEAITGMNIGKKEKVHSDEDIKKLKDARSKASGNAKKYLDNVLDSEEIHKEVDVVDDTKTAQLEKEVEGRIQKAIASGYLPHPDEVKDPWIEKQKARLGEKKERIVVKGLQVPEGYDPFGNCLRCGIGKDCIHE